VLVHIPKPKLLINTGFYGITNDTFIDTSNLMLFKKKVYLYG